MADPGKRIGILGGSFDPVHNGHISIAKSFLGSSYIDKLWVLLTPDPPHKTSKSLVDYSYRLKMLNAAFSGIKGVKVSDLEKELPQPSYTIQTLHYLSEKYPEHDFFLCLGGDSLRDFKKWKDWQKILEYCTLLVAQRPNLELPNIDVSIKKHTLFIDHTPIAISSTKVRNASKSGKDISAMVPDSVRKIISEENLYNKRN